MPSWGLDGRTSPPLFPAPSPPKRPKTATKHSSSLGSVKRGSWAKVGWAACLGLFLTLYIVAREAGTQPAFDLPALYAFIASQTKDGDCAIPRPDPWDPSIREYISPPSPLHCRSVQPELTSFDGRTGLLSVNRTALEKAGFGGISCSYQCFWRKEGIDDVSLDYGEWVEFTKPVEPGCEFFHVACRRSSFPGSVHTNVYAHYRHNESEQLSEPKPGSHSVLLLVLDSVSASNAKRNLPNTLRLLKERYGALLLDGYTKVGDNSFPNAVAFLAGKRSCTDEKEDELPCDNSNSFFDDWPLVWRNYSSHGYSTFYAEDYPNYNLFSYLSHGFRTRPTNAYFRPFWLHTWPSFLHRRSTHLCFGARPKLEVQLDYLSQFLHATTAANRPFFALDWQTELGHDWLNQVGVGDAALTAFFTAHSAQLDEAFVFLLSDHGHRFDAIRASVIGRLEESLPLLSVSVPRSLRESSKSRLLSTLKANAERLTSHYDLYATLMDILSGGYKDSEEGNSGKEKGNSETQCEMGLRGRSLLRPIPEKRTCVEAGIPEDYCPCQAEAELNVTEPVVQSAAGVILSSLNTRLNASTAPCAKLSLVAVRSASALLPNKALVDRPKGWWWGSGQAQGVFVQYRVVLEAAPSGALLEARVRAEESGLRLAGDVARINKYGNQSSCISDFHLRKFCFCQQQKVS